MSNELETALMGCVEEALMRDEYWEENPHYQCEQCGKKCKCRMDFCQCDEFIEKSLHYCDYECNGECGTDLDNLPTICDECLGADEKVLVSGIVCSACELVLEPHTTEEHLDTSHPIHSCLLGHKRNAYIMQSIRGRWIDKYNASLPQKITETEFGDMTVAIGGIYDGEQELYQFDNVMSARIKRELERTN